MVEAVKEDDCGIIALAEQMRDCLEIESQEECNNMLAPQV
jgi:hypothetical protein